MTNSKFVPLKQYLEGSSLSYIKLSFTDIERILNFSLCNSAYKYRVYWSLSKTHMLPQIVEEAGYFIEEVDMKNQTVVFRKK